MTEAQTPPGPLASLRILELADEKGQFCGKLMGDLGADVVKIEPPGGEATRTVGPFLSDLPHIRIARHGGGPPPAPRGPP